MFGLNSFSDIPTHYTHIDEESLVKSLKERNQAALDYLYDHYSGALYGVICRILRREDVSEEVLQDVFLRIWNRISEYDSQKGKLFTWMFRLARNLAIDRTRSREIANGSKTTGIEMVVSTQSDRLTQQQTDAIGVSAILDSLPHEQRFVIEQVYFKGYTQSEVAEEYELPLGTVKTRLRLALQHLRTRMDKF